MTTKNAMYPLSPRSPPSMNLQVRSPMSSPIARGSPLTFPSLSIPTKQVVQKPAENDHNKSETLSCGANDHGQLGHSDYIDTHELRYVTTTTKHLTRVVCGSFHNVSLHHGHIYVWGSNDEGQLGLPEYDISLNAATQVQYNVRKQNFKKIGAGARSSMGVTASGKVFVWGSNEHGELGLGDCDNRDVPEEVEALSEHKITDVCGGVDFCVFRTDKGELFTSGSNAFGQLGLGHNQDVDLPQLVPDIIAKKVCCGAHHCVALIDAKTIYSWGQNNHYQLGHGNNKNMNTPTRITTKLPHKIMNIYAGMNHTIILVEYGFVFTCGLGTSGQLGHGDTRYRTIPILLKSHRMTSIYCNSLANHWFGISNGKLFGVGSNAKGQLIMYNSTIRCGVPTELNVSGNVLDIGLGSEHSVVILEKHKPLVKNMHAFRDIDIITLTEYL